MGYHYYLAALIYSNSQLCMAVVGYVDPSSPISSSGYHGRDCLYHQGSIEGYQVRLHGSDPPRHFPKVAPLHSVSVYL